MGVSDLKRTRGEDGLSCGSSALLSHCESKPGGMVYVLSRGSLTCIQHSERERGSSEDTFLPQ